MYQEAVGGEAVAQNWCADAECHLLSTAHPPLSQTSVLQLLVTSVLFSPACGAKVMTEMCLYGSRAQALCLHLAAGL